MAINIPQSFAPYFPVFNFLPDTQTLEQKAQNYTPDLVGQFLKEISLDHHVAAFIEQDVSGDMLLEPEEDMLEELEVTSPIERLKIKVHVERKSWDAIEY